MPAQSPNITPDSDKTTFGAPQTTYSFDRRSRTFTGYNSRFSVPDGAQGLCSIVARFDFLGELEYGCIKVAGGIPSLGIAENSLLLQGRIFKVDTFFSGVFQANFLFLIEQDHHALGYTSHIGVWNSYMFIPDWEERHLRFLFRRSWGPLDAPLESLIGQVNQIVT